MEKLKEFIEKQDGYTIKKITDATKNRKAVKQMAVQTISHNDVRTDRHTYIGGSEISAIMGLNRWKTPLKLWAEKTQKLELADLSDVEMVEMGNDLEEFVAQKFSQKTGKAVRRAPKEYVHKDYPFLHAHIDRLVTGSEELLECKTCSLWKKDEWGGDDIPQEYILQVMWYLGITGRKIGHIAILIGGQSFKYKQIEFDAELFDTMVESAVEFWTEHVQKDIPPAVMPADDDTLKELYSTHNDVFIEMYSSGDARIDEAMTTLEESIKMLQETKTHIKSLQEEQKSIETRLKDLIKSNIGIKTDKYVVSWKEQTSKRLDTKALQEAMPEIATQFTKESSTRVLRIANNKEREVA